MWEGFPIDEKFIPHLEKKGPQSHGYLCGMVFRPNNEKNDMKDMAMFMGLFIAGYGLTMGLLYVVLSVFPKRKDRGINGVMKVSGNSKRETRELKGVDEPVKMKFANG